MNLKKIFEIIFNKFKTIKPKGFPIFATLIIDNVIKSLDWNNKFDFKKNLIEKRHENHAEWNLNFSIDQTKNINSLLLITFPPCSKCFDKIKKYKINKIIYFFDPWKKTKKSYLKNYKIEKINISLLNTSLVKYNLKLLIKKFKLWSHFRTHKIFVEKYKKIENIKYS